MPVDLTHTDRIHRGIRNYLAGLSAEDSVARHYEDIGCVLLDRRWRGLSGEIDLIVRDGKEFVFVEVKTAPTFAAAAERLTSRQLERIVGAAQEYVGGLPDGLRSAMRFDAALVDGQGRVETLMNLTLT